jgi:hypothetical protein
MLKKVMRVSAIAAIALVGLSTNPLSAGDSGCADAGKARFPNDHAARKEFKHWCKYQPDDLEQLHAFEIAAVGSPSQRTSRAMSSCFNQGSL